MPRTEASRLGDSPRPPPRGVCEKAAPRPTHVADWGVFRKSELVAHLPFGTMVRIGPAERACSGDEFCRVEAGDVAGWAVYSSSDIVDDADNSAGWRYEHYNNFKREEDTAADAPVGLQTTPTEHQEQLAIKTSALTIS